MKAMILAAGLGTRLRPLTNNKPKAMVEINGIPLLEIAIRRLIKVGVTDIIVNIHHFGQQIVDFLAEKENFGIRILISDERSALLETGGGLKKAAWFFETIGTDNTPFILYNADIISNINWDSMHKKHLETGADITLAVRNRVTSRYLLFDPKDAKLCGWKNEKTGEIILNDNLSFDEEKNTKNSFKQLAFSGLHIINPSFLRSNSLQKVYEGSFSIIKAYLHFMQHERGVIKAFEDNESIWLDVGKVKQLELAKDSLHLIDF